MSRNRVMVVAWSAAEWGAIHPALDRGELPNLASLVEGGSSGPLTTLAPLSIPIVATTLATGFHPPHHGVLSEIEPRPDGGGVEPTGQRSWRVPAMWENLARAGLKTAVVNWPATRPADRWSGILVDESFARPEGRDFYSWPLPLHCVEPKRLREVMRDLRLHPCDITSAELKSLLRGLSGADARSDHHHKGLTASLARTATVHAAATHIAENEEWNFLLVRYSLLADIWRNFDVKPASDGTENYRSAVAGGQRLLDVMLGRLVDLAGPGTTVFLVAPAGWRNASTTMSTSADSASAFGRGMLVSHGIGIKKDSLFHRASAVDIAPTVLACFGLSSPSDGEVLSTLFSGGIPNMKAVPPPAPPPEVEDDPASHLLALGYEARLEDAPIQALAAAELAKLRNLSDSYLALHQWDEAQTVLRQILSRVSDDYLANLKMARILLLKGNAQAARTYAEAATSAAPDLPWSDLLIGSSFAAAGDAARAEPHLKRAYQLGGNLPGVNLSLGWAAVMLQHWQNAENAFRAVIGSNPSVAEAYVGLGTSLHAQGQIKDAETALRRAVALSHDSPTAHLQLGKILFLRDAFADAAASLRVALDQNPKLSEATGLLSQIEKMLKRSPA